MLGNNNYHREETKAVIDAAGRLGLREIDLFRLAYREHWGREARSDQIEQLFADYMFRQQTPDWLTSFCHNILNCKGRLPVPIRAGARRYQRWHEPSKYGRLIVASAFVAMLAYGLGLSGMTYDTGTSAPPPCHYAPGFKAIADFAYAIHGRPPERCPDTNRPTLGSR